MQFAKGQRRHALARIERRHGFHALVAECGAYIPLTGRKTTKRANIRWQHKRPVTCRRPGCDKEQARL